MHVPCQQGPEQDAANQLSGIEGRSVLQRLGDLQHRATACVNSFEAIMVVRDHAVTAQSTILPTLGRLYASLQGLFKDEGIECQVRPFLTR